MEWVPVGGSATAVHRAPIAIEDTHVSNQQIDVTLAGNLNIGAIFGGTVASGRSRLLARRDGLFRPV